MDYKRKVIDLDLDYDLGITQSELKVATSKLEKSKANYSSKDDWLAAIDSIIMGHRNNPLGADIQAKEITENMKCPICGNIGEPITLPQNRKAYYCRNHRVVTPALVKEDG